MLLSAVANLALLRKCSLGNGTRVERKSMRLDLWAGFICMDTAEAVYATLLYNADCKRKKLIRLAFF